MGIVDEVIKEPLGGAHRDHRQMAATLKDSLQRAVQAVGHPNGSCWPAATRSSARSASTRSGSWNWMTGKGRRSRQSERPGRTIGRRKDRQYARAEAPGGPNSRLKADPQRPIMSVMFNSIPKNSGKNGLFLGRAACAVVALSHANPERSLPRSGSGRLDSSLERPRAQPASGTDRCLPTLPTTEAILGRGVQGAHRDPRPVQLASDAAHRVVRSTSRGSDFCRGARSASPSGR